MQGWYMCIKYYLDKSFLNLIMTPSGHMMLNMMVILHYNRWNHYDIACISCTSGTTV